MMSVRNLSEVPHVLKKHLSGKKTRAKSKNPFLKILSKAENRNPYKQKDEWSGLQLQW